MKKKITSALILVLIMISTTFAANIDENVNETVLSTFSQRFTQAKEVNWTKSGTYYKASFNWNDQHLFAYFTFQGQLMGITRNLVISQIPINLQAEIKKKLPGSWVTELCEVVTEDETAYYATIENSEQKLTLKSFSNSAWTTTQKVKKN